MLGSAPDDDQHLDAIDTAFARGEEHRCEAARWQPLVARLGRPLTLPGDDRGPRVDVGAGFNQRAHHVGVPLRGGPHERRLASPAVTGVERRTVRDQDLRGLDFSGMRAGMKRRLAVGAGRIRADACRNQLLDDGRAAALAGERDGGDAVSIGGLDVGAGANQSLDERRRRCCARPSEAASCRPAQRCSDRRAYRAARSPSCCLRPSRPAPAADP